MNFVSFVKIGAKERRGFVIKNPNCGGILKVYNEHSFYNRLAETLLGRKVIVCGTMRANRGIPREEQGEGKPLKKGQSSFRR
jgi:hypothetical protein